MKIFLQQKSELWYCTVHVPVLLGITITTLYMYTVHVHTPLPGLAHLNFFRRHFLFGSCGHPYQHGVVCIWPPGARVSCPVCAWGGALLPWQCHRPLLRLPKFQLPDMLGYNKSPVMCVKLYGNCPDDFMAKMQSYQSKMNGRSFSARVSSFFFPPSLPLFVSVSLSLSRYFVSLLVFSSICFPFVFCLCLSFSL